MIKSILVPTDGSSHAKKAIDYASDLAVKYNATLHLLHVITESKIPEGLDEYIKVEGIKDPTERVLLEKVGDAILEAGQNLAKEKGVKDVRPSVLIGDPAGRIIEFAKDNGVDAIIMGSRGLGGIKSLFLGSVSSKVCNLADCTCMTVK
jgi:nucleotide-binding universal stress UspA family protein